jgi:hypothetical protein
MWVLSDVSRVSHNFQLYAQKDGYAMASGELNLAAANNVIVRLCQHIPLAVNHKVFYDNFFSGIPLLT